MTAAAIKTIAVHLPTPGLAQRLLDTAIPLAKAHDAVLVGVHVLPAVVVYADATVSMSTEFIVAQQEAFQEDARGVEQTFTSRAKAAGIAHEWRRSDTGDEPTMRAPPPPATPPTWSSPRNMTTASPPPAATAPTSWRSAPGGQSSSCRPGATLRPIGRRVLVAWNGSREASRALFDCLSLMQPGAELQLLSVDSARGDATLGAIADALSRHGVNPVATSTSRGEGRSVPEEILKVAADFQADLLALGCYGHSRLRETVFGGATTRILRDMTLPVLMAH